MRSWARLCLAGLRWAWLLAGSGWAWLGLAGSSWGLRRPSCDLLAALLPTSDLLGPCGGLPGSFAQPLLMPCSGAFPGPPGGLPAAFPLPSEVQPAQPTGGHLSPDPAGARERSSPVHGSSCFLPMVGGVTSPHTPGSSDILFSCCICGSPYVSPKIFRVSPVISTCFPRCSMTVLDVPAFAYVLLHVTFPVCSKTQG